MAEPFRENQYLRSVLIYIYGQNENGGRIIKAATRIQA